MKKKLGAIVLAVALVVTLGVGVVFANDQIPSAKCAFVSTEVAYVDTGWTTILETQIKAAGNKDLIIDVSAETCLVTNVRLDGDAGSEATATILVRVMVDGTQAAPGDVTFNNRVLKVEGDLTHHYGGNPLLIDDHWIAIFMETKSANSFSFCIENVGKTDDGQPTTHTVLVQAMKVEDVDPPSKKGGSKTEAAWAEAMLGWASVVVEEVDLKTPVTYTQPTP